MVVTNVSGGTKEAEVEGESNGADLCTHMHPDIDAVGAGKVLHELGLLPDHPVVVFVRPDQSLPDERAWRFCVDVGGRLDPVNGSFDHHLEEESRRSPWVKRLGCQSAAQQVGWYYWRDLLPDHSVRRMIDYVNAVDTSPIPEGSMSERTALGRRKKVFPVGDFLFLCAVRLTDALARDSELAFHAGWDALSGGLILHRSSGTFRRSRVRLRGSGDHRLLHQVDEVLALLERAGEPELVSRLEEYATMAIEEGERIRKGLTKFYRRIRGGREPGCAVRPTIYGQALLFHGPWTHRQVKLWAERYPEAPTLISYRQKPEEAIQVKTVKDAMVDFRPYVRKLLGEGYQVDPRSTQFALFTRSDETVQRLLGLMQNPC